MRYYIIIIMLAIASIALPAKAKNDAEFDRLVEKLRNHPEIMANSYKAESAKYFAKGELGLPDPMLFIQDQDYPIGSSLSQDQEEKMIGFKQEIPNPFLLRSRSEKINSESQKQRIIADYSFTTMKAKMFGLFAELEKVKKLKEIAEQQKKILNTEKSSVKGRISANQSSLSQLDMTKADAVETDMMLVDLDEEQHEIEAMLKSMFGEIPNIKAPEIQMKSWNDEVEKTYPVKIAQADSETAHKEVNTKEAEFLPNFEVQANYTNMNNGDNAGTVMLGVSIPLWAEQNQRQKLKGANSALSAARSDEENIKRETNEKLSHLKAQIMASEKKIELLQHKQSLLKDAAHAESRDYGAGKSDFIAVLKTLREALSVKSDLVTEQSKHITLIANFNSYIIEGETK